MKPVERSGYIDVWIIVQQGVDGKFLQQTTHMGALGSGFFATLKDAQHEQTIQLLKGNKVQIFHLEFPL